MGATESSHGKHLQLASPICSVFGRSQLKCALRSLILGCSPRALLHEAALFDNPGVKTHCYVPLEAERLSARRDTTAASCSASRAAFFRGMTYFAEGPVGLVFACASALSLASFAAAFAHLAISYWYQPVVV